MCNILPSKPSCPRLGTRKVETLPVSLAHKRTCVFLNVTSAWLLNSTYQVLLFFYNMLSLDRSTWNRLSIPYFYKFFLLFVGWFTDVVSWWLLGIRRLCIHRVQVHLCNISVPETRFPASSYPHPSHCYCLYGIMWLRCVDTPAIQVSI